MLLLFWFERRIAVRVHAGTSSSTTCCNASGRSDGFCLRHAIPSLFEWISKYGKHGWSRRGHDDSYWEWEKQSVVTKMIDSCRFLWNHQEILPFLNRYDNIVRNLQWLTSRLHRLMDNTTPIFFVMMVLSVEGRIVVATNRTSTICAQTTRSKLTLRKSQSTLLTCEALLPQG